MLILMQDDQAIVDAVCNLKSEATEEVRAMALDWLCDQHYAEIELLVSSLRVTRSRVADCTKAETT